jgi:soluble lytic murein transglycosylase-like protein
MDIASIQDRISTIQARIEQISDMVNGPTPTQSFSSTLADAQLNVNGGQAPVAPDGETVRPLSADDLNISRVSTLPSSELDPIVNTASQKYGVDPGIIKAVIQTESDGNPNAISSAGAMGLMQLMPSNIVGSDVSNPYDPAQNIDAGVSQLSGYLKKYGGDLDQALAAYNAGPAAVKQYHGIPPYTETQNYIKKIHAILGH